jgi:beta-phosphoglucomutase-like phosphatase (HAD superfamily)
MTSTTPVVTLSPRDYDAVLFDLDGVLTKTASVHAAAWKKLFDGFLERRAADKGEAFVPFDIDADYRRYVDGKPRYDGVTSFLNARGIGLWLGSAADGPDTQTVHGLGNRKDRYFSEQIEQHGVEVYAPAIELVRALRELEIKTAVVSSSENCAAAGIAQLFDTRVDGNDVVRMNLRGKPAPDAFLEAARRPVRLRADPRYSYGAGPRAGRRAHPVGVPR